MKNYLLGFLTCTALALGAFVVHEKFTIKPSCHHWQEHPPPNFCMPIPYIDRLPITPPKKKKHKPAPDILMKDQTLGK